MLFSEKKSANNEDKCHIFVNFFLSLKKKRIEWGKGGEMILNDREWKKRIIGIDQNGRHSRSSRSRT